jgi:tripartite-type tricarboxylate transporter receptor subunit TctC
MNPVRASHFSRRRFMAAGAAALSSISPVARAQSYPARPVRIIVGFAAGGGNDILARLIGQWLSERLGQQFIIENRPGAAANIATEAVVRAAADGYTLLLVGPPNAINATLYDKLNFDFLRDIAPVAGISREANIVEIHPSIPAKTIPQFIAFAKANPGRINMASAGIGSAGHVAGELFKMTTGINMTHVPYRGLAPALTDLIAGHIPAMFVPISEALPQARAGLIRMLAVSSATRSPEAPEVPSLAEQGFPGFHMVSWTGMMAPAGTPKEIIDRMAAEFARALKDPQFVELMQKAGVEPAEDASPAAFAAFIAKEIALWGEAVKIAGVTLQ